jgi:hypothetical protein
MRQSLKGRAPGEQSRAAQFSVASDEPAARVALGAWRIVIILAMELVAYILALALACFGGVQFCYLMFLQAANRQQQRRIAELERELVSLHRSLDRQSAPTAETVEETTEEVWADLIDDGSN